MSQVRNPMLVETPPVGLASLPLSVVSNDLEILLSQTNRPWSIVLICSAPNDSSVAIELAMGTGDWAWAARALVRSLAVTRILAGAGSDVAQLVVEQPELGEAEPLLLAGAALAHSWFDIASSALARAAAELAQAPEPDVTDGLSLVMLNTALSRLHDEAALGLAQARHAQDLMVNLTASQRAQAPELSPMIDYYVAGFELTRGNLDTARWTLERGAGRFRQSLDAHASPAEQRVRADCAGQLSWIDAFCGDLRRAMRSAAYLLTDRQADGGELGVKFAHLATAWSHIERGELEQARQRLDHALSTVSDTVDPLLSAAEQLTEARLAIVTGEPESALRVLHAVDAETSGSWFADQFRIATAEAWLATGEPQQAIAALSPEPELAPAEAKLTLVRALRLVGELGAAEKVLEGVPSDPATIPLITQVQRWMLAAELAFEQGNRERAELLADRALRAAAREQLRTTVALSDHGWAGSWLRAFVAREPGLSRRYSAFLATVPELALPPARYRLDDADSGGALFVAPLTNRETQVLRRLAEFCSNEEIAADLVLSLNTVKTHMRSLFQKLSVTRRADAVRRGRALGLC
jgi:LuxR family transcriptional regulator, maltose regulon positive regulatory protein